MANNILDLGYAGSFVSTGESVILKLPAGVQSIDVFNLTLGAASQTTAVGVEFKWNAGLPDGSMWVYFKSNAAAAANLTQYITSSGFVLLDNSSVANGPLQSTITAISSAAIPVVTNTGTNGLVAGDVVRIYNVVGALQFGGIDFTVGNNTLSATTFSLDYAPQIVAGTTGSFRLVAREPLYEPTNRFITDITNASEAVITLSVDHNYVVAQQLRLHVPEIYGMVEADTLAVTVLAVDEVNNTITVDLDTTSFTAFEFPLSADAPFTPALVSPLGVNEAAALANEVPSLLEAWRNEGFVGLLLPGGANNPAGANGNSISFVAYAPSVTNGFLQ